LSIERLFVGGPANGERYSVLEDSERIAVAVWPSVKYDPKKRFERLYDIVVKKEWYIKTPIGEYFFIMRHDSLTKEQALARLIQNYASPNAAKQMELQCDCSGDGIGRAYRRRY
jgi:hypothetical protein